MYDSTSYTPPTVQCTVHYANKPYLVRLCYAKGTRADAVVCIVVLTNLTEVEVLTWRIPLEKNNEYQKHVWRAISFWFNVDSTPQACGPQAFLFYFFYTIPLVPNTVRWTSHLTAYHGLDAPSAARGGEACVAQPTSRSRLQRHTNAPR